MALEGEKIEDAASSAAPSEEPAAALSEELVPAPYEELVADAPATFLEEGKPYSAAVKEGKGEMIVRSHAEDRSEVLNTVDDGRKTTPDNSEEDASALATMTRCGSVRNRRRLEPKWLEAFLSKKEVHEETAKANDMDDLYDLIYSLATNEFKAVSVASGINSIAEAVYKYNAGKAFVRECGGLSVAIHAMAKCIEDPNVQIAGCKLLENEAEDDHQVQDLVGGLEGIDAILDAMTRHRDIIAVQDAAAFALRSLTWGEENRKTIVRHGVMHDLVKALEVHPNSPMLHEHIICTIAHCVFGNDEGRKVCGTVGAVKAILRTMKNYPDIVSLQAQCCFALRNLSWQCPENVTRMHENKAQDEIIATLIRFCRIPGIQDQGLAALSNVFGLDSQPLRNAANNANKELVTVVFKALKTFATHQSITRHAQTLFITIAESSKSSGNSVALKHILTYPDAAKIILRPIASPSSRNFNEVLNASKILKSIGSLDGMQADVRNCAGISTVLECLVQFAPSNISKAHHILDALNAICSGSDLSKQEFNKVGGVGKIAALMLENPKETAFQESCCMVLDNISNGQFEATAANMACRTEAMRAVVAAMILYPQSASLQEHACSVMIKVAATSQTDSDDLCGLGARPVVEKARMEHSGNPAVESLANQLLTLLIPSGKDGREGRGSTPQGSSSSRLRSRSRTVQTGQRSRSRMDRSKSREKKKRPGFGGLSAVDENSNGDLNAEEGAGKPKRSAGSKPESRKGRRGGNRVAPSRTAPMASFEEEEE